MLFNSLEFFAFFSIVYVLYRLLPLRGQNRLLLVAGYVFYGWWDVRFLFLIAFSTTVDFWIGLMLGEGRVPRRERLTASAFILGAAFLFVCIDWAGYRSGGIAALAHLTPLGLATFAGTALVAAAAHLAHDRMAALEPVRRRRLLLFLTVFVNLGFLATFKYFNFFIGSATQALQALGFDAAGWHLDVILPVGISFYTFQSLSYTLDVSRDRIRPAHRFFDFALFVAFFPPMVAGPIERARHLLPQLQRARTVTFEQTSHGILLILLGLFKKVAIADGLAIPVNAVFDSSGAVSGGDVALASVLFAFQIYCDFSGYTDIARGVAKMLGIELMINFDLPYFSRNPSEFWRRWHISLSSWLRDYLYISLGGNRHGERRTYANLMTTMTLGGLWHGAAWNYVLWGVYQGALLCGHRFLTGKRPSLPGPEQAIERPHARLALVRDRGVHAAQIAFFFVFVCYGWMLFRATSFGQIADFTRLLAGLGPAVPSVIPVPVLSAVLGLAILLGLQVWEYRDGRPEAFRYWPPAAKGALYAAMIFVTAMGTSNAPVQFIYFQF